MRNNSQLTLRENSMKQRFQGTYFLTGLVVKVAKNHEPYWILTVSDSTLRLPLYLFANAPDFKGIQPNSLIYVSAVKGIHLGEAYFKCTEFDSVSEIPNSCKKLDLLPTELCPAGNGVKDLLFIHSLISNTLLSEFVARVLMQPHVLIPYISCPASLKHHHCYVGGLLEHSLDVAWQFFSNTSLNKEERDIGIVCGLLHDIGKTMTLTPELTRTAMGRLVDHDELTLEICAPALKWLQSRSYRLACLLRHAWTCASPGARYGYKAHTHVARLLQKADHLSSLRSKCTIRPLCFDTKTLKNLIYQKALN